MKKLGKLKINPEKRINNEDLINLRGGDTKTWYTCTCYDENYVYFEEDVLMYDWAVDRYIKTTCWSEHDGQCVEIA